jgi:hypothetical protein
VCVYIKKVGQYSKNLFLYPIDIGFQASKRREKLEWSESQDASFFPFSARQFAFNL